MLMYQKLKDLGWEAKNSIDDVIKNLIGKRLF